MKVFITGATGFIGRHLVNTLYREGHEITINLREDECSPFQNSIYKYSFNEFNINSNIDFFKKEGFDGIIHLASLYLTSHKSVEVGQLIDSNVRFGSIVLECACVANVKWFINAGTSWQNFRNSKYSPVNLYAASKQAFQSIAQYFIETNQIKFCTIKLFDTFGPEDSRQKVFNLWHKVALSGEIIEMSSGEQVIDMSYIDDIVSAFILLAVHLNEGLTEILNGDEFVVKAKQRYTLKELSVIFEEVTGYKLNIIWGKKPYRKREVMIPSEYGKAVPGWEPKFDLAEGIRAIIINRKA